MELDEDYTAGILKGTPIFLIRRTYTAKISPTPLISIRYAVILKNKIEVSIIQFSNKMYSGEMDFEMMVIKTNGIFIDSKNAYDSDDVYRGNANEIHNMLCKLESLI